MLEDLDLSSIADERARQLVQQLLNVLEDVMADLRAAQAENQRLRDEINRLKGEQGAPAIKANTPQPPPKDHSSEQERRKPKTWSKDRKTDRIALDREQVVQVDPTYLPPDAVFKGYEDVVVQDVIFRTDNVLFHKEKFYSPSQHQTYLASLPQGYRGQFGPGLKSLALVFYFGAQMSEPKVAELLRSVGVQISDGQVSNLLIKDQAAFHGEKEALYQAGLASSPWQHLDDTSTRVNGQNGYCHIVCNPLYTAYFTTAAKDRLTIIDVLTNHRPRRFLVNAEALGYLEVWGLSTVRRRQMGQLPSGMIMDDVTMQAVLETHLPGVGPQQRKWILDATAVAAYHADVEFPVVRLLVCDDAPQFTLVTEELALCWVHEGRHYKKLMPAHPASSCAAGGLRAALLDVLRPVAGVSGAADAGGGGAIRWGVRDAVRDRHRLRCAGRADCQDPGQEKLPAHGADAPRNSPAQQPGRTGSARPGAQTGCELRAAHLRGSQGVGHLHDTGGDRDKTGSQFLSLHP